MNPPPRLRPSWNPKRLGVKAMKVAGLETDVWCCLTGRNLEIVIQVNQNGVVMGTNVYQVRVPA